ncbi:MAG: DNA helicase RecG, partial [Armatimonadota bacterium]
MAQSTTPFSDKSIYTGRKDASRLNTPVQYIKGVGPRLAALFGKLGVFTVRDLLFYLPRRHEDRSQFARINRLEHGEQYLVLGEIIAVDNVQTRGKMVLTKVMIDDGGGVLTLTWFNQKWLKDKFLKLLRKKIVVYGTAQIGRWGVEMNTPEWELYSENDETISFGRVVPIYSLTEGLTQLQVRKAVKTALDEYSCDVVDILPNDIKDRIDLVDVQYALMNIHFPESMQAMEAARKRLVFDELFLLQLALAIRKRGIEKPGNGISFKIPDNFEDELNQMLPFELTNAQKRVIGEIAKDMSRPICMN